MVECWKHAWVAQLVACQMAPGHSPCQVGAPDRPATACRLFRLRRL